MAIKIVEYEPEHEAGVAGLNQRLRAGGARWGFFERAKPKWLPPGASEAAERRYYLALDEKGLVHGGYCLKHQTFVSDGTPLRAASIQGPVSESLIDSKFSMLPVLLLRDMIRREPLLFAWGASRALTGLLERLHWSALNGPLLLKLVHVSRCLRHLQDLRRRSYVRGLVPIAAVTGAGAAAVHTAQWLQARRGSGKAASVSATQVSRLGPWADRIWAAGAGEYAFSAVRDAKAMNGLLPEGAAAWPESLTFRVDRDSEPIGWAVLRDTQFADDDRFGALRVGSVIDLLSLPGFESATVDAATRFLEGRDVDLVLSHDTNAAWVSAYRSNGYFELGARRQLYLSPELARQLGEPTSLARFRLTLLDGDGPHGF